MKHDVLKAAAFYEHRIALGSKKFFIWRHLFLNPCLFISHIWMICLVQTGKWWKLLNSSHVIQWIQRKWRTGSLDQIILILKTNLIYHGYQLISCCLLLHSRRIFANCSSSSVMAIIIQGAYLNIIALLLLTLSKRQLFKSVDLCLLLNLTTIDDNG